jgi:hypothetical protein
MNKPHSRTCDRSQERMPHRHSDDEIQYLLRAEEQILQSISTRALLPEALNKICHALNCQIGDVVSFISLPGDDASELAAIAMNALVFGLHTFCSEAIVTENNEVLGFLEMYSSVPRRPSASEFQLIERANCLAAIAIKLQKKADHQSNCGMRGDRPVRGRVLECPVPTN